MQVSAPWLVARERAVYVWIAFTIPAASTFGHALAPGEPFFKGQDLGILIGLAAACLAALAWMPFRRQAVWTRTTLTFFGLLLAAWTYQVVRTQLDQSLFNLTAFVVPLVLLLIVSKPASRRDVDTALLVLAYSLLAIAMTSLVVGRIGWMPDGFEVSDAGGARYEFLQPLGIPGRWGGPFGSVNYASPIGGLLLMIGVTRRSWNRVALVTGGVGILALGQGRTALFAVVAGLLVLAIASRHVAQLRHATLARLGILAVALSLASAYIWAIDPTFNGRTPLWRNFLALLDANPVFGVGDSGIWQYVGENAGTPGFVPHVHAHSVLLDATVRYGALMGLLTLGIFVVAVAAGVRAIRRGYTAPLAITVFVIAAGLTETIHAWGYWTVYSAALTWAVMASDRTPPDAKTSPDRPDSLS